jgi:hypothetical protein
VLSPQQVGAPSVLIAQVCMKPAAIWVTLPVPGGTVLCPSAFSPQQTGVPPLLIAHEWKPPADTDGPAASAGVADSTSPVTPSKIAVKNRFNTDDLRGHCGTRKSSVAAVF